MWFHVRNLTAPSPARPPLNIHLIAAPQKAQAQPVRLRPARHLLPRPQPQQPQQPLQPQRQPQAAA